MIKIKDTDFIVGLIIESGLLSFVISLQFDGLTNAIGKIHSSIWRVAFKMLNVWINVWSMLRRFNWILNFSTFNIYLTHFADNLCEWATVDKLINGPALLISVNEKSTWSSSWNSWKLLSYCVQIDWKRQQWYCWCVLGIK